MEGAVSQKKSQCPCILLHLCPETTNIHLYSPERQQQQVKEAPNTQQQKQTNKREKKLRSNRAD